jgi:phosphatidylglycerophosphate synthase/choline kinase
MIRQGILVFDDTNSDIEEIAQLKVAGRTLLDRGIRTMARAGIEHLLVIAPQEQSTDLAAYSKELGISLEATHWGGDISSFLTPGEPLVLLLGEYVHHHSSLHALMEHHSLQADLIAQVSSAAETTAEVGTTDRYVQMAAGELTFSQNSEQDALVSSGAFAWRADTSTINELLHKSCDIWTFIAAHFQHRRIRVENVAADLWHRVDTVQSARRAKDMLFDQVSKSTSGIVARILNVRISVPISKILIDTGISPNLATFFLVFLPGLFSAYLVAHPDSYIYLAFAGLLWQLASILDGCDGEIARVKLAETAFGAWLDTLTDNLAYLCAYTGIIVGMYRLYPESLLPIAAGVSAVASLLLTLGFLYFNALKTGTGSLQYYLTSLANKVPVEEQDWSFRLVERYGFLTKRDFLSFAIALGMIANQFELVFWTLVVLIHGAALGVLTTTYKMQDKAANASMAKTPQTHSAQLQLSVSQAQEKKI